MAFIVVHYSFVLLFSTQIKKKYHVKLSSDFPNNNKKGKKNEIKFTCQNVSFEEITSPNSRQFNLFLSHVRSVESPEGGHKWCMVASQLKITGAHSYHNLVASSYGPDWVIDQQVPSRKPWLFECIFIGLILFVKGGLNLL